MYSRPLWSGRDAFYEKEPLLSAGCRLPLAATARESLHVAGRAGKGQSKGSQQKSDQSGAENAGSHNTQGEEHHREEGGSQDPYKQSVQGGAGAFTAVFPAGKGGSHYQHCQIDHGDPQQDPQKCRRDGNHPGDLQKRRDHAHYHGGNDCPEGAFALALTLTVHHLYHLHWQYMPKKVGKCKKGTE